MSIFVYQKHPDHCLGGENYPHFRNQADKIAYTRNLIDLLKPIDFQITRDSFDTATVNLNVAKLDKKPHTIAGIATGEIPIKGNPQLEYWWVTGWNMGANSSVVSFNLTLDYWLTYWPLKLNETLVRVHKRHTPRFWKHNSKADFYLDPRFTLENRSLVNQEADLPLASTDFNSLTNNLFHPKITFDHRSNLARYLVIVVNNPAGEISSVLGEHNNYYSFLGYQKPRNQNAMVIFGDPGDPAISSWLSSPGITHSCYVWLNTSDFNVLNYSVTYEKGKFFSKGMGNYFLNDQSEKMIDKTKLNCVRVSSSEVPHTIEGYMSIFYMLVRYVALTAEFENAIRYKKKYAVLAVGEGNRVFWMSESENQTYQYYLKDLRTAQIPGLSLFFNAQKASIKSDHWSNQIVRQYQNVYFTSLDAFNEYLTYSNRANHQNIKLEMGFKKIFKGSKAFIGNKYQPYFQLKMYTHFKYLLNYQTAIQEYQPWTFTWNNQVYRDPSFHYWWIITIQNSYFICDPQSNLKNIAKTFTFIAENQSKALTYNDQMLKFYQQQGVSFQTGFDQALFFQNWTKKYNKIQYASLGQNTIRTSGIVSGVAGALSKPTNFLLSQKRQRLMELAKSGLTVGGVVGGFTGGMNAVSNILKTSLDNQLRDKKAVYGVQSLLAQQTDLSANPATSSGLQKLELNYWITTKFYSDFDNRQKPYLTVLAPSYNDFMAQALIYHKYGYLLDQEEIVDFNDVWTRYYFNYWQIHNLEQAIVKNNLNSMVLNWFNSLFNQGIRLWNVFNSEVTFNDYSKENWESKIIRPANENQ